MFYAFILSSLNINFQRGQIPDNDVVTFSVFVNQKPVANHVGTFGGLTSGTSVVVQRAAEIDGPWALGPFRFAEGGIVTIVYTGTNSSDLPSDQQGKIEAQILDAVLTGVIGAAGLGVVGSVIGEVLGAIGDPVGKFLGIKPEGPCNGPVFHDAIDFTVAGLPQLAFTPLTNPDYGGIELHRSYTDAETHDGDICGHIAETDVSFSILRFPYLSVADWLGRRGASVRNGIKPRNLAPGSSVMVSQLLGLISA